MGNSQEIAKKAREEGDKLDVRVGEIMSISTIATVVQILFLLGFGAAWVVIFRNLKKSNN